MSARKMVAAEPSWFDDHATTSWEPKTAADLKFLKDSLRPHAAEFESVYKPIRHKIYGHRLMSDEQAGIDLFPQTSRVMVGKILDFLHDIVESIAELYNYGKRPILGRDFADYNDGIREEAAAVLRRLAEHVQVGRQDSGGQR